MQYSVGDVVTIGGTRMTVVKVSVNLVETKWFDGAGLHRGVFDKNRLIPCNVLVPPDVMFAVRSYNGIQF